MGEIRFQTSSESDHLIDEVCRKLGIHRAELGRIALFTYLKDFKL